MGPSSRLHAGRRRSLALLAGAGLAALLPRGGAATIAAAAPFRTADATWHDAARNRDVPVRIRVPAAGAALPLLLFSHGLGGSRAGGAQWAEYWAAHGYAVIAVQHPGSDESLWRGGDDAAALAREPGERDKLVARLKTGISIRSFLDRVADIHFVIDEALAQRGRGGAPLAAIDGERIGMSGHSFGAVTTQAICGERFAGQGFADVRVRAGLAFSPSSGKLGDPQARFAAVTIPMLLVTGTRDGDVIGNGATPDTRRATFDLMPAPGKYLLVLDAATHMNFNGGEMQNATPDGRHYRAAVEAVSLAFWDATLRGDAAARAWLAGGAGDALATGDVFLAK
jgi:predicted dienelactone hydrolase